MSAELPVAPIAHQPDDWLASVKNGRGRLWDGHRVERLARLLVGLPPGPEPPADAPAVLLTTAETARRLRMSVRTLHRRAHEARIAVNQGSEEGQAA